MEEVPVLSAVASPAHSLAGSLAGGLQLPSATLKEQQREKDRLQMENLNLKLRIKYLEELFGEGCALLPSVWDADSLSLEHGRMLQIAQNEIRDREILLEKAKADLHSKQERLQIAREELSDKDHTIRSLTRRLEKLEGRRVEGCESPTQGVIRTLEQRCREAELTAEQRCRETEQAAEERCREAELTAEQRCQAAEEDSASLRKQCDRDVEALKESVNAARAERDNILADLQSERAACVVAVHEATAKAKELAKTQQELKQEKTSAETLSNELRKVRRDLEQLEKSNSEHANHIRTMEADRKVEVESLTDKLMSAENEVDRLQKRVIAAEEQLSVVRKSETELTASLDKEKLLKKQERDAAVAEANDKMTALLAKLDAISRERDAAVADACRARDTLDAISRERDAAVADACRARDTLDAVVQEKKTHSAETTRARGQMCDELTNSLRARDILRVELDVALKDKEKISAEGVRVRDEMHAEMEALRGSVRAGAAREARLQSDIDSLAKEADYLKLRADKEAQACSRERELSAKLLNERDIAVNDVEKLKGEISTMKQRSRDTHGGSRGEAPREFTAKQHAALAESSQQGLLEAIQTRNRLHEEVAELQRDHECARKGMQVLDAEMAGMRAEKESLLAEKASLLKERDAAREKLVEPETESSVLEGLHRWQRRLQSERDALLAEKESLFSIRKAQEAELLKLRAERESLAQDRDAFKAEKASFLSSERAFSELQGQKRGASSELSPQVRSPQVREAVNDTARMNNKLASDWQSISKGASSAHVDSAAAALTDISSSRPLASFAQHEDVARLRDCNRVLILELEDTRRRLAAEKRRRAALERDISLDKVVSIRPYVIEESMARMADGKAGEQQGAQRFGSSTSRDVALSSRDVNNTSRDAAWQRGHFNEVLTPPGSKLRSVDAKAPNAAVKSSLAGLRLSPSDAVLRRTRDPFASLNL